MPLFALVDAGPIIAYYNKTDSYHAQINDFFKGLTYQLITTDPCITEAMHALRRAHQVQIKLAQDVVDGSWHREPLESRDFERIAELFEKYSNVPADFADLSIVAISERLNIDSIITLDSDFDIYRRFRTNAKPFHRLFYPHP